MCIELLSQRFPKSPRVEVLIGIRKEASLPAEAVLEYYDRLLEADESNAVRVEFGQLHYSPSLISP